MRKTRQRQTRRDGKVRIPARARVDRGKSGGGKGENGRRTPPVVRGIVRGGLVDGGHEGVGVRVVKITKTDRHLHHDYKKAGERHALPVHVYFSKRLQNLKCGPAHPAGCILRSAVQSTRTQCSTPRRPKSPLRDPASQSEDTNTDTNTDTTQTAFIH